MRFFIFLLLFSHANGSSSQPIPFDSLRKVVTGAQSKHEQINAIMVLGSAFRPSQADSIFLYVDKIKAMPADEANAAYAAHAEAFLKGVGYFKKSDISRAKPYLKKSASYFEATNPEQALKAYNFLGGAYSRNNELDSAEMIFEYILSQATPSNKQALQSAYGNLGIVYRRSGDYTKAIEYFELCAKVDPSDDFSILNSYLNVAAMFVDMEMYQEAVYTLRKVKADTCADSPVKLAYYNNQGENFFHLKSFDSAAFYLKKGLRLAESIKQYHQMVNTLTLLASVHLAKNELDQARANLKKAGELCPKYCPPPVLIEKEKRLIQLYMASGQADSAIAKGKEVILLAEQNGVVGPLGNLYSLVASAFDQLGDAASANNYYKLQQSHVEKTNLSAKTKMIANARMKYETSQKEKLLAEGKREAAFYQKLSFRLTVGSVIMLLISLLAYYRFFKTKSELIVKEEELGLLKKEFQAFSKKLTQESEPQPEHILLRSKALVNLNDLMYVKSDGHYAELHLESKSMPEVDRNTIGAINELLPASQFVQVHRSYVVNINFIRAVYSKELVLKNGQTINISRSFKAMIEDMLVNNAA